MLNAACHLPRLQEWEDPPPCDGDIPRLKASELRADLVEEIGQILGYLPVSLAWAQRTYIKGLRFICRFLGPYILEKDPALLLIEDNSLLNSKVIGSPGGNELIRLLF